MSLPSEARLASTSSRIARLLNRANSIEPDGPPEESTQHDADTEPSSTSSAETNVSAGTTSSVAEGAVVDTSEPADDEASKQTSMTRRRPSALSSEQPTTEGPEDLSSRAIMCDRNIWVLDTETTGLSPTNDRVIEIALMQYTPHPRVRSTDVHSWLINPDRPLSRQASRVHGITDSMLANQPAFPQVWSEVKNIIEREEDAIRTEEGASARSRRPSQMLPPLIVAHNASFDRRFLLEELRRSRLEVPTWDWACSFRGLAKRVWPLRGAGLSALVASLGGPPFDAHRAAADVKALCFVMDKAADELGTESDAASVSNTDRPRMPRGLSPEPYNLVMIKLEQTAVHFDGEPCPGSRASGSVQRTPESRAQPQEPLTPQRNLRPSPATSEVTPEQTVYVVPDGQVWHRVRDCARLGRSPVVHATVSPNNRRPCQVCVSPEPPICSICHDPLAVRSTHKLTCSHEFHADCFASWTAIQRVCPVCRSPTSRETAPLPRQPTQGATSTTSTTASVNVQRSPLFGTPSQFQLPPRSSSEIRSSPTTTGTTSTSAPSTGDHYNPFGAIGSTASTLAPSYSTEASTPTLRSTASPVRHNSTEPHTSFPTTYPYQSPSQSSSRASSSSPSRVLDTTPSRPSSRYQQIYYGTANGECYHEDSNCRGLMSARQIIPISSYARRPCRVCVENGNPSPTTTHSMPRSTARNLLPTFDESASTTVTSQVTTRSSVARHSVYVAPTGSVWHSSPTCRGLRTAGSVDSVASPPAGRRPCRLCSP